jgi:hypothetical protein
VDGRRWTAKSERAGATGGSRGGSRGGVARWLLVALVLTAGGCLKSEPLDTSSIAGPQPVVVTVVPASAIVKAGATQQFGVSFQPTPPDPRVVWSVADTVTASIDASGKLLALSPGKTTVTATLVADAGRKGVAQVQVNP